MGHSLNSKSQLNVYYNSPADLECYVSMATILRPIKKAKTQPTLSTITLGILHSKKNSFKQKHQRRVKILVNLGCGATLIHHSFVGKLALQMDRLSNWSTKAGNFRTTKTAKLNFTLPAFHEGRNISWTAFVDETAKLSSRYDMIISRDLLEELGMNFLFSTNLMEWDNASTPMLDLELFDQDNHDELAQELLYMHDPDTTEAERIQEILDAKYCKADLAKLSQECDQLDKADQQKMLTLLQKYEHLFDGTVGTWNTEPVDLILKDPNCKPYHAKPYPVPYSQEQKLKEEVNRLCEQGILQKINKSEWACPMFTISKPDGSLWSLADLRELNKRI